MKIKVDFVTNSSSTSFIITNKSDQTLTLYDFVKENPQLIERFIQHYDWYKDSKEFTQEGMLECADKNNEDILPGSHKMVFGDEQGWTIGHVFDYILRDGGSSENFSWCFHEYNR